MATIPRPTPFTVRNLHTRLQHQWSARIAEDRTMQALVHQRNEIERLEEDKHRDVTPKTIHSGRAGGIIEHAVGLLMAPPSFHVEPITPATQDKRKADHIEQVLARVFERQVLRNDFWTKVAREVLIYGRSFVKALPLPAVWTTQEGFPVRRKTGRGMESPAAYLERVRKWKASEGKFPFVIQHIPAMNVLPLLDSNDQPIATIEEKAVMAKVLVEEMKSGTVKDLVDSGAISWYDELPVIEYIDQNYVGYYLVSTQPVLEQDREAFLLSPAAMQSTMYEELRVFEHGLGRCPVVLFPGLVTEVKDYRDHFKSFLKDAAEALETYDFLLSRLKTMVWAYYLPSFVRKVPTTFAQAQGKRPDDLEVLLGSVTTIFMDEDFAPLEMPGNLPDATLLMREVDDMIQRNSVEDVLLGRVTGSAPAYQVNLRINVARSKFTPISQHLAQGATELMELFLRGVVQLNDDVVIDGETITPAEAKRALGRVTVTIQTKNMFDRNADIGTMNMALQVGFPWDWAARELVGVENPALLRLERDIEQLEQAPEAQAALLRDALDMLELRVEEEEFVDAGQLDASQFPPAFLPALQQAMEQAQQEPGLGRGPFPPGAAPQTIQGGRGLNSQKAQPQPGSMMAGTDVLPGGMPPPPPARAG